MPIKFRCQKCRQFLGISRNQAGRIVDCPTCGRSTRVPNLDGTVDPLPGKPRLDTSDSSLLNALDQLAQLNEDGPAVSSSAEVKAEEAPAEVASAAEGAGVAAVSEAAELSEGSELAQPEIAEAAVPIALEPLAPAKAVDPPPQSEKKASFIAPEAQSAPADVLESLAARAVPQPSSGESAAKTSPWQLAVLTVIALVLTAAGWAVGRFTAPQNSSGGEPRAAVPIPPEPETPVDGIVGRVTYRKSESECIPDRGSRIIAWPAGMSTDPPLKLDGFRTGDPDSLTRGAMDRLTGIGGGMAVADEQGQFQLPLPSGGDYEVLFLSRFSGRQIDEEGVSLAQLTRLKGCFAEPLKLLGKTQFRLMRLKFRGDGPQLLDQVFEVAD